MNKLLATVATVAMLSSATAAFAQDNSMSAPASDGMSKTDTTTTTKTTKHTHKHKGKHHKKSSTDSTSSDTTK